jgi:hypothetical protein
MAEDNLDLEVTGFETLRAQIKEATIQMQMLAAAGKTGSEEFTAAANKVADLKDQLDDANDAVSALTGAGKIQAFGKGISAIAGGFTAVQGAISLAGGDAKEFEKTMQKLQGAMALSQGLSQLEDLGNAFGNMKKVAVGAFNSIKTAIGASGIGLLVVALGTIYAYWDDIKAAVSGVSSEQETLNQQSAENLAIQTENLAAVDAQENILKLQGKSEEEIYDLKVKQYDQTIEAAKVNLVNMKATEEAQIKAAQRNKDILQGIIRFISLPITILLAQIDLVGKALGQDFGLEEKFSGGLAGMVFDPEDVKKEGDKTIKEAEKKLTELENKRAGLVVQHNEKKKAERQKELDDRKQADQKENDLQAQHLKNLQKLRDDEYVLAGTTEEERARRQLEVKQKEQDSELNILIKGYTDKKKLTKEEQESLATLNAEYAQLQVTQQAETDALIQKQVDDAAKKKAEADKKAADDAIAATKEEYDKTKGYLDEYFKSKETALLDANLSEKELAEATYKLELENLEAQKKAAEDYGQSVIDIDNQIAKVKKDNRDKEKAESAANLKEAFDLTAQAAQAASDLSQAAYAERLSNVKKGSEEEKAILKEQFETQKKFQIGMAIINGAQSVLAITSVPDFTLGVASAIRIALVGITTAATIAKISATQFEGGSSTGSAPAAKSSGGTYGSLQTGGLLGGPSHDLGGIKTSMGELEGGEFVINRRATANFLPLLNQINASGNTPGPQMAQQQQQPVIKTYVVASDMSSQQEANAKLQALSML